MTKEDMQKVVNDRFNEIAEEHKKISDFMVARQILFYKSPNGIEEILEEEDNRWKEIFNEVFEKGTSANEIMKNLVENSNWAKKIFFIWVENKFSLKLYKEIFKNRLTVEIFNPIGRRKNVICIFTDKRSKKVKIYLFS